VGGGGKKHAYRMKGGESVKRKADGENETKRGGLLGGGVNGG